MSQQDPLTEVTLESRRIFDGKVVNLRIDKVRLPNGKTSEREIVEHRQAVVIIPMDGEGRVLLVRQYRKAIEASMLELPAGGMEEGETPEQSADRELREETGYAPGKLERLTGFYVAPGYAEEYLHLFLATDLHESPLKPDEDEFAELVPMSLEGAVDMVFDRSINDAKSIIGLLWVWRGRNA
ncbi:MAG: ADP-ribose pyrophosphatase [Nitrospira sp.]|nr:ADP-ribose pyrophosphatase [Nitrospira sp.]